MPVAMTLRQSTERRAEMRGGVVPELRDQRMPLEDGLHDRALRAAAASVNQAKLPQAGLVRGAYVLVDDGRDVARREGMEIELRFDGDAVRIPGSVTPASRIPRPRTS